MICSELADSTEAYEAGVAGIIKKTAPIYPPFVVPFTESRLTPDEFVVLLNYINTSKSETLPSTPYMIKCSIVDPLKFLQACRPNP